MVGNQKRILFSVVLKLTALFVFVFFLTFFIFLESTNTLEKEKMTLEIVWPKEGGVLLNEQEFIFCVKGREEMENLSVYWRVDNGIKIGEVKLDKGGCFKDLVDVSFWDWNKNGKYNVSFLVFDANGHKLDETSVLVFANVEGSYEVENFEFKEETETEVSLEENLSAISVIFGERISDSVVETKKENTISVKMRQTNENEKYLFNFVIEDEDIETLSLVAFWQSKGGHKNLIHKNRESNYYQVLIDFSGWKWMGEGPYGVIFSLASEDGMKKIFEEEWQMMRVDRGLQFSVLNSTISEDYIQELNVYEKEEEKTEVKLIEEVYFLAKPSKFPVVPIYRPEKPVVRFAMERVESSEDESKLSFVYEQPGAVWLNGDGNDNEQFLRKVAEEVERQKTLPVFVLYNIPNRDCGSHSSGGAREVVLYKSWVDRIANSLQSIEAVFVIEPDALAQLNCLPENERKERIELIRFATERLGNLPNFHIYIDAGHPFWIKPEEMAKRLTEAGVSSASGFALNVSNFVATEEVIRYGNYLGFLTGGSRYVIDTSRNGNGHHEDFEWCNPSGRALGELPRVVRGERFLDAFLWIKYPGESDGECNGGPSAGAWWTEYALNLFKESKFFGQHQ